MVCPDVFEMLHLDAVVEHQLQGFGADSFIPIRLNLNKIAMSETVVRYGRPFFYVTGTLQSNFL